MYATHLTKTANRAFALYWTSLTKKWNLGKLVKKNLIMREIPNVVLIEWNNSLVLIGDEFKSVWWSRIPTAVKQRIEEFQYKPMVLHWHEETLRDLYRTVDGTFGEFVENTKSLLADRLPPGTNNSVFVFGTKTVLVAIKKAICNREVLPEISFTYSFCTAFSFSADIYFVYEREGSTGLILQKANYAPIKDTAFLLQPHPK